MPRNARRFLGLHCVDCTVGTMTLDDYSCVHDSVWEEAWRGRRKPWHVIDDQEILCIGCLEKRIGRTLTRHDFTDVPINELGFFDQSARLRDRLTADGPPRKVEP
jgi:hypothetical protein